MDLFLSVADFVKALTQTDRGGHGGGLHIYVCVVCGLVGWGGGWHNQTSFHTAW